MVEQFSETARFNMIQQQIRPWEVLDQRVLEVMQAIPREEFVPDGYRRLAFADTEIPLGNGQSMLAPKIEARLLQALDLRPTDRILEVGTGSGYLTACLARLGGQVLSLEIEPEFTEQARQRLQRLGIDNVELRTADALAEPPVDGAFEAIAITGSLPTEERLADFRTRLTFGGRLFVVVGEAPVMTALLVTRVGENEYSREPLFETLLTPLRNAPTPERFVF